MGVLYRSRYNSLCKTNGGDRDWRHKACNIENGLRYIRTIEREYGEYTQQKFVDKVIKDAESSLVSSDKSIRISKISNYVGIASLVIGVISVFIAFNIARQSTTELKEVKESLQRDIEIIPTSLLETESQIQGLSIKQDSLQKNNLDLQQQLQSVAKRVDDLFWIVRKQSD